MNDAKQKKLTRELDITLSDNLIINATIFLPPASSIKNKSPLAILLPSLGGSKNIYEPLAKDLNSKGIAAIAINPRGHSNSTTKTTGKKLFWQTMSKAQYAKYPTDIEEILESLEGKATDRIREPQGIWNFI